MVVLSCVGPDPVATPALRDEHGRNEVGPYAERILKFTHAERSAACRSWQTGEPFHEPFTQSRLPNFHTRGYRYTYLDTGKAFSFEFPDICTHISHFHDLGGWWLQGSEAVVAGRETQVTQRC